MKPLRAIPLICMIFLSGCVMPHEPKPMRDSVAVGEVIAAQTQTKCACPAQPCCKDNCPCAKK